MEQVVNPEVKTSYDFVETVAPGIGQRHPHGLTGFLWRVRDPETVRVGDCFLAGRLKQGDLFLCTGHSGDCFQDYMYVKEYNNCLVGLPELNFGSYGIGDAEPYPLKAGQFDILENGGRIEL